MHPTSSESERTAQAPGCDKKHAFRILDMTAGNRGIWFDKQHPAAVFVDIRPEVGPDLIADSGALPNSIGNNFSLVLLDPPHYNTGANSNMAKSYGHHTAAEIRNFIVRAAKEAHRVTAPDALLAFKWSTKGLVLKSVLPLFSPWWIPLFGTATTQSVQRHLNYWIMLRRADLKHAFPWETP
jgi:hypothetical protein